MTSAEQVRELLDRTEANIKLIEQVNPGFAVPTLNEWRYVSRHVTMTFFTSDAEEREREMEKTHNHLKRAYFDSCDIALDCYLELLRRMTKPFRGYVDAAKTAAGDYPAWIEAMRNARDAHEWGAGHSR